MNDTESKESRLTQEALQYHAGDDTDANRPGKIAIAVTKPARTARDLTLAYSPGVAAPVRAIAANAQDAYRYTAKGNLVAVISNGSAILGLGNLGPLASKPVMEGKALLFKVLADVDALDIEVNAETPEQMVETVRRIADTFGGINLEDIRAPECFEIEEKLCELCKIPIFHDDQHGTAIVTVAGLINALEICGKKIHKTRTVMLGAGAAAIASRNLMVAFGCDPENILMLDRKGVIHTGRNDLPEYKRAVAVDTSARDLPDALQGADIFIGLSGPNLLSPEALGVMAENPIVFACSNPDPEISPELAHSVRDDIIMATGRSDYPNQINNVLGFPYIFRGALDVRASSINLPMKQAAVNALVDIARDEDIPAELASDYGQDTLRFGKDYIIPKPTDPRLKKRVAQAVADAAVESGVACPILTAELKQMAHAAEDEGDAPAPVQPDLKRS